MVFIHADRRIPESLANVESVKASDRRLDYLLEGRSARACACDGGEIAYSAQRPTRTLP